MDIYEKQYYQKAGFCGDCGLAIKPDPKEKEVLGECLFDGNHLKASKDVCKTCNNQCRDCILKGYSCNECYSRV